MPRLVLIRVACVVASALVALPASAQPLPSIPLVVNAGRPMRIALDRRIRVKRTDQQVNGTLVEAVYAYDRMVLPAGTRAIGHVAALERLPRRVRVRAMLAGDFAPPRRVELQFDELVLMDGRKIPIRASANEGAENVVLRVADAAKPADAIANARDAIVREGKQQAAVITAPAKGERLKVALIRSLPYHPQLLPKGTVYTARLLSPIDFGVVVPAPLAAADAKPAADSVLRAHLVTAVGSAVSTPGAPVAALLAQPIFDADGGLILPEGTKLVGEVTFARPARRFHRSGQMRLLFEGVQAPGRDAEPLLASLHAVESPRGDRLNLDQEGGATSKSSSVRFAAPALAALALVGATSGRLDYDTDGLGPEMQYGGPVSGTVGGFVGLGLFGVTNTALGGRYVTVAITVYGLTRTVYAAVFGKGREISFPDGTSIQVQLAPRQER